MDYNIIFIDGSERLYYDVDSVSWDEKKYYLRNDIDEYLAIIPYDKVFIIETIDAVVQPKMNKCGDCNG